MAIERPFGFEMDFVKKPISRSASWFFVFILEFILITIFDFPQAWDLNDLYQHLTTKDRYSSRTARDEEVERDLTGKIKWWLRLDINDCSLKNYCWGQEWETHIYDTKNLNRIFYFLIIFTIVGALYFVYPYFLRSPLFCTIFGFWNGGWGGFSTFSRRRSRVFF